jgi:FixJ family two-component response regulator
MAGDCGRRAGRIAARHFILLYRYKQEKKRMNAQSHTVFIVDDAREVRAGLSRLLGAAGYQVRAFDSAASFLKGQDAEVPGCLLLDVCMPGCSGIELQDSLLGSRQARPIVFLTGSGDVRTGVSAMKQGAVDFLTKPVDQVLLFAAVNQALQRDTKQRLERALVDSIQQRLDMLTPRERQVLDQVIRGKLNKQIAAALDTGEKTVKVHRARVMSKMMARSVAELVQLTARAGVSIEA